MPRANKTPRADVLERAGAIPETAPRTGARNRAIEFRERYGLTDSEIAKATDATARTVHRWRNQGEFERASRYDQRLADLLEVTEALEEFLPPEHVRPWLTRRNDLLDGARPLHLLGAGLTSLVLRAVAEAKRRTRS